eukprot:TRINITY_DN15300_c0_g1_i1.p2 TRINITY_DN15300_c0_g1~~TRINITY_DN15300_c0_g1_i1.p2  ORF type:complete len:100 (-),score=2.79 TRINITY_DN15300_c0_g1_i1:17-316(-)
MKSETVDKSGQSITNLSENLKCSFSILQQISHAIRERQKRFISSLDNKLESVITQLDIDPKQILTRKHVKLILEILLSLIHICRCRRSTLCRSRWSPYH